MFYLFPPSWTCFSPQTHVYFIFAAFLIISPLITLKRGQIAFYVFQFFLSLFLFSYLIFKFGSYKNISERKFNQNRIKFLKITLRLNDQTFRDGVVNHAGKAGLLN